MKRLIGKTALWLLRWIDEETKREILTEVVKDKFCIIGADEILKENPDGSMNFEGKLFDSSFRKNLREQAIILDNLLLWKVLRKDLHYQIIQKMYREANTDLDNVWWKLLVFYDEIIRARIEKLKR